MWEGEVFLLFVLVEFFFDDMIVIWGFLNLSWLFNCVIDIWDVV